MTDVVATGLFTLAGVIIGVLLTPLTQLFLEWKRQNSAAGRAKLNIAGELLHAQLVTRSISLMDRWPYAEDANAAIALLPSSVWEENRSSVVGHVDEHLFAQLVAIHARFVAERIHLVAVSKTPDRQFSTEDAEKWKKFSDEIGRLKRELGQGSGWPDELSN